MPATSEPEGLGGQLPDEAVVIRGGLMARDGLIASARRYADQNEGIYGITLWSWPGLTAGEIAQRVKEDHAQGRNPVGHGQLRWSTAGVIREAMSAGRAFILKKTGQDGHYTLTFPSEPSDGDWDRLEKMFGPPEPNPAAD